MRTLLHRTIWLTLALSAVFVPATSSRAASPNFKDVCASGCTYSSLQTAIDSITDSSATNVYTVFIDSGVLTTDTSITMNGKSYINLVGRGIGVSVLRGSANWYINNQPSFSDVDLLDLSNSTNITIRALTIDARTGDPCLQGQGCFGPNTYYAGVKTNMANRIVVQDAEIMGITYGIWENDNTAGNLIQVFSSKVLASNYGIGIRKATWHIFASDVRAVANGGTSGSVGVAYGVNVGASSVENTTIWGSHLHAETGDPGKTYNVAAVNVAFVNGSQLSIVGSTLHVKVTTTDIGSSTRPMFSFLSTAPCGGTTPAAKVNLVGSDLLYESPTGLTQGKLGGLGWSGTPRCVNINLTGDSFIDAGGSGGTYRGDLVGQPMPISNQEPVVNTAGTQLTTVINTSATPFVTGSGSLFNTSNVQNGKVTFPGSNTVTVTLPTALPDANYRIIATPNVSETIYVSARTATNFTLKSSKAGSTAAVDWMLVR